MPTTSKYVERFYSLLIGLIPDITQALLSQLYQNLHDHYTQPHRHYHTLTHIANMFKWFDKVESELHNPDAVQLAIWYHDVIYEPKKSDDERQSANYFINTYAEYLPSALLKQVEALIMMTAKHELFEGLSEDMVSDASYFLDMDLAILGREWSVYEQYAKQVRLEYSHVSLADYQRGRIAVLNSFLDKERLYFTDRMFDELEGQARENIDREIEQLQL